MKLRRLWKPVAALLLLAAIVFLPLGRTYEWSSDSVQWRTCLTWAGHQVSPYTPREDAMTKWVHADLHFKPAPAPPQDWQQTAGGPFWNHWFNGTPGGSWSWLHALHRWYVQMPGTTKPEVCAVGAQLVASQKSVSPREITLIAAQRGWGRLLYSDSTGKTSNLSATGQTRKP